MGTVCLATSMLRKTWTSADACAVAFSMPHFLLGWGLGLHLGLDVMKTIIFIFMFDALRPWKSTMAWKMRPHRALRFLHKPFGGKVLGAWRPGGPARAVRFLHKLPGIAQGSLGEAGGAWGSMGRWGTIRRGAQVKFSTAKI
jgi:hypothetical protein